MYVYFKQVNISTGVIWGRKFSVRTYIICPESLLFHFLYDTYNWKKTHLNYLQQNQVQIT